jgi:hypothetical protein
MSQNFYRRRSLYLLTIFFHGFGALVLSISGWFSISGKANAQPGFLPCQPPKSGESLLLIVTNSTENQQQIMGILPPQVVATACQYLDDVVLRVEGFPHINAASNWAEYITSNLGLPAFVAVPQGESTMPSPGSTAVSQPYNPQPLGRGYAVLVDYFSNPQVAAELQQLSPQQSVGLVSYQQRPYLLAEFTENQNTAKKVLQTLSDRGFWVLMVDAPGVILLRSQVTIP